MRVVNKMNLTSKRKKALSLAFTSVLLGLSFALVPAPAFAKITSTALDDAFSKALDKAPPEMSATAPDDVVGDITETRPVTVAETKKDLTPTTTQTPTKQPAPIPPAVANDFAATLPIDSSGTVQPLTSTNPASREKEIAVAALTEDPAASGHYLPTPEPEAKAAELKPALTEPLQLPAKAAPTAAIQQESPIIRDLDLYPRAETAPNGATFQSNMTNDWMQQLQALEQENQVLRKKLQIKETDVLSDIRIDAVANIREEVLRSRVFELETELRKTHVKDGGDLLPLKTGPNQLP